MSRMPSSGDVVDDVFRVERELDRGNFGAVYKVRDLLEDRILALKVLKPGPHDEDELRQRFEREASLIYQLQHPHIVQVYYYGETDTALPYMAMEYLEGTDLKSLLRHHGQLAPPLARRIAIESLSALGTAHAAGIVHRDLKPGNVYLVDDGDKGHVKVLDFGFAKALESDNSREITTAGTLVGTPAYMSPEQVHKEDVGPPADLYAMGLILAEMLAGEKIVQIEGVYDTVRFQGSRSKPIPLPQALTESDFGDVLQRSVSKQLDTRYDTAREMIDDLCALQLDDAGPYTRHVPLGAPREIGDADPDAHTTPRTGNQPPLQAVEAELEATADPSPDDFQLADEFHVSATPATGASHTGTDPQLGPTDIGLDDSSSPGGSGSAPGISRPENAKANPSHSGRHPSQSGRRPTQSGRHPSQSGRHPSQTGNNPRPSSTRSGAHSSPEQTHRSNPPAEQHDTSETHPPSQRQIAADEPNPRRRQAPTEQRRRPDVDGSPSIVRDLLIGVVVGGVVLAIIILVAG